MANLSDSQIIKGQIPQSQILDLEQRLIELFFAKVKREGKQVTFETDVDAYCDSKINGRVFEGEKYILLVDDNKQIVDITPVVYHCITTDEGLQYAKIMLQRGYLPPSERPATS